MYIRLNDIVHPKNENSVKIYLPSQTTHFDILYVSVELLGVSIYSFFCEFLQVSIHFDRNKCEWEFHVRAKYFPFQMSHFSVQVYTRCPTKFSLV